MPPRFSCVVGGMVAGRLGFRRHVYASDCLALEDQRLGSPWTRYKYGSDSLDENLLPHLHLQPPLPVFTPPSNSIAIRAHRTSPSDSQPWGRGPSESVRPPARRTRRAKLAPQNGRKARARRRHSAASNARVFSAPRTRKLGGFLGMKLPRPQQALRESASWTTFTGVCLSPSNLFSSLSCAPTGSNCTISPQLDPALVLLHRAVRVLSRGEAALGPIQADLPSEVAAEQRQPPSTQRMQHSAEDSLLHHGLPRLGYRVEK